jgi:hypothetical protein
VLVQIDESRGNYESGSMNDAPTAQRCGGDAGNLPVADADAADRIQPGLWIHDASPIDDQVILLSTSDCGKKKAEKQDQVAHKRPIIRWRGRGLPGVDRTVRF